MGIYLNRSHILLYGKKKHNGAFCTVFPTEAIFFCMARKKRNVAFCIVLLICGGVMPPQIEKPWVNNAFFILYQYTIKTRWIINKIE